MRLLVTGKGGATGSWQIRGEQLGHAIGAEVVPFASLGSTSIGRGVLPIVVKRSPAQVLKQIGDRPWVYDVVDAWPQPAGNGWGRDAAIH